MKRTIINGLIEGGLPPLGMALSTFAATSPEWQKSQHPTEVERGTDGEEALLGFGQGCLPLWQESRAIKFGWWGIGQVAGAQQIDRTAGIEEFEDRMGLPGGQVCGCLEVKKLVRLAAEEE